MSDKVYTLPDLPASATGDSELQTLVRRLIEYADFSTLVPIVDKLREQDRNRDLRQVQWHIASHLCPVKSALSYRLFAMHMLGIFWFDLYDVASTATAMANTPFVVSQPNGHYIRLSNTDASAEEVTGLRRYGDENERRRRLMENAAVPQRIRSTDLIELLRSTKTEG